MGVSFVVAAYLQVVRGYDAIQTGVIFTAATVGLLASSLGAERFATRRPQRTLIMAGFLVTIAGIGVLLAMVIGNPSVWAFTPGLLLIGLGLGLMLTPSVNVVQSSFPEEQQGEISGCRAASPTSARRWAPRSPAPSWSPASPPRPSAPTGWR
jgi:MFS family permease